MNNIPNDVLEEIILNKVKLFAKENYYSQFRTILLELYKNIFAFKKKSSLSFSITAKIKERNNKSLWNIISLLIFPLKSQLNNADLYENEYNLNPLCFQYLKNLCYNKMKKLSNLSTVEKVSIDRVVPIYLNLCEKQIRFNKDKKKGTLRLKGNYLQMNTNRKASILISSQNSIIPRPQLKINLKKIINKNGPSIQPLEYANSFTRLFIGETDDKSIRERYLSNMIVKKQKQLHLLNSYGEFSLMYLKKMYKKLFKDEGSKSTMDNDMISVIKQFENDHRKIDNFQRNAENEKPHYLNDYNNYLVLELNKQKEKIKGKNRNIKAKRNIIKYNSNSLVKSADVSRNKRVSNMKGIYSRKRIDISKIKNRQQYSVNIEKNKNIEGVLFNKRITNSSGNYKNLNGKNNKCNSYGSNLKKNFSAIFGRNKYNNFISSKKKKIYIKNYMSKSDFFFL